MADRAHAPESAVAFENLLDIAIEKIDDGDDAPRIAFRVEQTGVRMDARR